jgi:3-oxoacyl-[acyl-carrier protein] reductase
MTSRLSGRVAIVTGAGRGIGRAIALALAKEGASLIVYDFDVASAAAVVKEIETLGVKGAAAGGDIGKKADAERLVRAAVDDFGELDILVNNAGIVRDLSLFKMAEGDWDDVVDTCLKGTFLCSQAAAFVMSDMAKKEQEAGVALKARKIINLTSGAAIRGNPGQANYCAAKAGVIGLTKSMARELARYNILVNAIAPLAWTRPLESMSEQWKRAMLARVPLGRFGDPERDIAPVATFLASDDANFITGQVIIVNGGLDM